jgi:hypothetical protein
VTPPVNLAGEHVALGQLFDPPDGYRFADGFLVTYELSIATLVRRVLPTLCGAEIGDRYAIGELAPRLTVAHERVHAGPMMTSWNVELVQPTDKRILHAKGGLLRFEPIDARRPLLLRGWVGSANLTDSGLYSNQELVLFGECRLTDLDPAVDAAAALCFEVAKVTNSSHRLRSVLRHAMARTRRSAARLRHTIDKPGRLLDAVTPPDGFDHLEIVTPVFQTQNSGRAIARALEPILPGAGGTVDIYTTTDLDLQESIEHVDTAAFSRSLVDALEARKLTVTVHFTPEQHGPDAPRRALHTKAYALHGTDRSTLLVGSANCTVAGLSRNREALVELDLPYAEAAHLIRGSFDGWLWTGLELDESQLPDRPPDGQAGDPRPLAGAYASLTPTDATTARGHWSGRLVLHGLQAGAKVEVEVAGHRVSGVVRADGTLDVTELLRWEAIELLPDQGKVVIRVGGQEHELLLWVHAGPDWYENMAKLTDRQLRPSTRGELEELQWLNRQHRRFLRTSSQTGRGPSGGAAPAADDRLTLPIERRFEVVARYAARLPSNDEAYLAQLLEVTTDDPRLDVIRAIVGAGTNGDALLARLKGAVTEAELMSS